jgi:hypothetical protein
MLKSLALSLLLCAASGLVVAQDTAPSTPSNSSPTVQPESSSPRDGAKSVRGCLSGSSGNFTLTENQTGTVYALTGSPDMLSSHVGHEIEIMGQPATGGSSASHSSGGAANANRGAAVNSPPINTYQISSVKELSDHCGTGSVTGP